MSKSTPQAQSQQRLSSSVETIKSHYDVVIIGSGYGGGIAASRLSRMGKSVCVLERGKEWQTGEFPNRFPEIRNELNIRGGQARPGRETGLFDLRLGKDIHIIAGNGLGGGSLINAAVALRPDDRVFEDKAWPEDLRQGDKLDQAFTRAAVYLRPTQDPRAFEMTKAKALQKCGKAFNAEVVASSVVISYEDTINPAGIEQAACTRCGDCCSGCNVGAKNTIALTYLPDAKKHGASLFSECKVSHIRASEQDEKGRWQVIFYPSDANGKEVEDNLQAVSADSVVFSAGTLGTTELLLRSKAKGLPLSDKVGHHFSANGDVIAFGYNTDEAVNAVGVGHPAKVEIDEVGASVSVQLNLTDDKVLNNSIKIEEGVIPSAIAPLLPVMFVPGGRLMSAVSGLIKGVYKGPLSKTQTFFAVSHDDANGQMILDKNDKLVIDWPDVKKQSYIKNVDDTLTKATKAIGGRYLKNPLATGVMGGKPASAHPLGGCKMGNDRMDGVVNHKCQLFDNNAQEQTAVIEGLYVCDGSIIARSLGVNPLLTISALTERAMMIYSEDQSLTLEV